MAGNRARQKTASMYAVLSKSESSLLRPISSQLRISGSQPIPFLPYRRVDARLARGCAKRGESQAPQYNRETHLLNSSLQAVHQGKGDQHMQASGFRAHGGDRFFVLPVRGLGPTASGAAYLGYLSGLRKARFAIHARPPFVRLGGPEICYTKRTKGGMSAPQRYVQLCLANTISVRKRGDVCRSSIL